MLTNRINILIFSCFTVAISANPMETIGKRLQDEFKEKIHLFDLDSTASHLPSDEEWLRSSKPIEVVCSQSLSRLVETLTSGVTKSTAPEVIVNPIRVGGAKDFLDRTSQTLLLDEDLSFIANERNLKSIGILTNESPFYGSLLLIQGENPPYFIFNAKNDGSTHLPMDGAFQYVRLNEDELYVALRILILKKLNPTDDASKPHDPYK